jgi:preprotein translocase subunit SecD
VGSKILRLFVLALVFGACGGDETRPEQPPAPPPDDPLAFYDWEANVIGPRGRPEPDDPAVTGGSAAGAAAYGLSRTQAKRRLEDGMTLVRAEEADDAFYVLRDRPALTGADITNPEQSFDNSPGGSGQPIVTFDFTDRGREAFEALTRELAERGARMRVPGGDPLEAAQHFAIVLDGRLVSVPYVDFERNPNGIDAANGSQIEGGLTIESARELVARLKGGPPPARPEARGEEPGG